ncbi:hypothetical protein GmHk_04G011086 [Glycine max]|nr:hypothetical protein GmHk_04G011086 [Glycine max]
MNIENEEDAGVKVEHVDCSNAFNTSQLFATRDEVFHWARSVAYEIGFVVVIMRTHNHEMAKSFVGHPYAGRLTKDEKIFVVDMTKSMNAYRSSIRGTNTEMQQLMMLLERDQYIHWHRMKDENVVHDLFWSHPDAVKLTNSCNLVFLIDNTYKTNRYKLSLLDIVGVTPTGMTFFAAYVDLEGECLNNVVWALQRFQGLFMKVDALLRVIVTNRDLSLMNAVKTVFPDATNLLIRFHINKNVKAKCKTLIAQKMHGIM